MIVDDNEINILMIEDFLRSRNYNVFSALSGLDFLAQVNEIRPDIILMDIQMPDMDGLETIRRLRSLTDPGLASIPVIAITALAMPGDRERCLDAGANDYISKPVRLKELVSTIHQMLLGEEDIHE
jgi:CheY-like chemotaxis protein